MVRPRILLIRLGAIGDVVRTLPALRLIRRRFPNAHIAWIVEDRSLAVVKDHPDLDETILLSRDRLVMRLSEPDTFFGGLAETFELFADLRRHRFDISLDFQGTFKSGLTAWAAGAPLRIGYDRRSVKEGNQYFNNVRVRLPRRPVHRVERNLALVGALGIHHGEGPVTAALPIADAQRSEADAALAAVGLRGREFVLLYPGSSRLQAWKRYPPERFGAVAKGLLAAGVRAVVAPGPGEDTIATTMQGIAGRDLAILPQTSLLALAEVIRRARLFIGADTGPMHMAWIQGVPVVALLGPTDPALNAPWGPGHVCLDAATIGGTPSAADAANAAGPRRPPREAPPLRRHDASVFKRLPAEQVVSAALSLLAKERTLADPLAAGRAS